MWYMRIKSLDTTQSCVSEVSRLVHYRAEFRHRSMTAGTVSARTSFTYLFTPNLRLDFGYPVCPSFWTSFSSTLFTSNKIRPCLPHCLDASRATWRAQLCYIVVLRLCLVRPFLFVERFVFFLSPPVSFFFVFLCVLFLRTVSCGSNITSRHFDLCIQMKTTISGGITLLQITHSMLMLANARFQKHVRGFGLVDRRSRFHNTLYKKS